MTTPIPAPATETRPLVLVTGCEKYRTYLEASLVRFAHPAFRVVGFVGDPTGTLTAPVFNEATQIVALPVSDIYEALPAKVHAAFSWAAATFPAVPGIWKTDDDIVYANKDHLVAAIQGLAEEPYWGLFVGACRANPVNPWRIQERFEDKTLRPQHQQAIYCYGHGYWVSRAALPLIVAAGDTYRGSFLEDVCTGYVLNRAKLIPKRCPIVYSELPRGPELLSAK